jgi:subtilisin family serine protease
MRMRLGLIGLAGVGLFVWKVASPLAPAHRVPPGGEVLMVLMTKDCFLPPARGDGPVDKPAVFNQRLTCVQTSQKDVTDWLDLEKVDYERLPLVNGLLIWARPGDRDQVCHNRDCFVATSGPILYPPDRVARNTNRPPVRPTPPRLILPAGMALDQAKAVSIGFSDTGFDLKPETLASHYRVVQPSAGNPHTYNWFDAFEDCLEPCDQDATAHGTSVVGEAMVSLPEGVPVSFFGCRETQSYKADDKFFVRCLDFLWSPFDKPGKTGIRRPELGADVINVSGGCYPEKSQTCRICVQRMLDTFAASNVLVVTAAGDTDKGGKYISSLPALDPRAVTVGGTQGFGSLYDHSPIGDSSRCKPDVVANAISLSVPSRSGSGWADKEGNSYTSPQVAAAAATVWALYGWGGGSRSSSSMATLIRNSATAIPDTSNLCPGSDLTVPNRLFGHGSVTVEGVQKRAVPSPVPTPGPTPGP